MSGKTAHRNIHNMSGEKKARKVQNKIKRVLLQQWGCSFPTLWLWHSLHAGCDENVRGYAPFLPSEDQLKRSFQHRS